MCFNVTIDEDCMIFEWYLSLKAIYLKCSWNIFAVVSLQHNQIYFSVFLLDFSITSTQLKCIQINCSNLAYFKYYQFSIVKIRVFSLSKNVNVFVVYIAWNKCISNTF